MTDTQWSALHQATKLNNLELVMHLVKRGASVNNGKEWGFTAVTICAQEGFTEICEYLIYHGAEMDMKIGDDDWQPIHFAASEGHTETLMLLVEKGVDMNTPTNKADTPLDIALEFEHEECSEMLETLGAKTVNY